MNIAGFYPESIANGDGYRAVLFVSGCPHACPGCHNSETQDPNYGELFTKERRAEIIEQIVNNSILKGITLTGGEPFWLPNVPFVLDFTKEILARRPDFNVWSYSGYKFSQLKNRDDSASIELLNLVDVLVDGKFIQSKYDPQLRFRGSSNQKIIQVKPSLAQNKIVLHEFISYLDKM